MCFMSIYYFFNALPVHQGDSHIPGKDEVFNWQSSQFVNLFCFKDTFSGMIQSKQSRKMFLARKTEGIFQTYINSENCKLGFSCGREGRVAENLDFTAQIWGCLGTLAAFGPRHAWEQTKCIVNNKLPQFSATSPYPVFRTAGSQKQRMQSQLDEVYNLSLLLYRWLYLWLLQSSQVKQVI